MKRFKFKSKEYIESNSVNLSWATEEMAYLITNEIYSLDDPECGYSLVEESSFQSIRGYSSAYILMIPKVYIESPTSMEHYWFIKPDAIEWEESLTKEELNNPKLKQFIKELEEIDNI